MADLTRPSRELLNPVATWKDGHTVKLMTHLALALDVVEDAEWQHETCPYGEQCRVCRALAAYQKGVADE